MSFASDEESSSMALPADLPEPSDDGASNHLPGKRLPPVALPATDGSSVDLASLGGRSVVYAYPRTGPPREPELLPDWDLIPGARGCTEEACSFRDHHSELEGLGARVFGLSTIEHVLYPVFPPDTHAEEVQLWLSAQPRSVDEGATA